MQNRNATFASHFLYFVCQPLRFDWLSSSAIVINEQAPNNGSGCKLPFSHVFFHQNSVKICDVDGNLASHINDFGGKNKTKQKSITFAK